MMMKTQMSFILMALVKIRVSGKFMIGPKQKLANMVYAFKKIVAAYKSSHGKNITRLSFIINHQQNQEKRKEKELRIMRKVCQGVFITYRVIKKTSSINTYNHG